MVRKRGRTRTGVQSLAHTHAESAWQESSDLLANDPPKLADELDVRLELFGRDGLDEKVVGAGLKGCDLVGD
jgi:hypothetical protein